MAAILVDVNKRIYGSARDYKIENQNVGGRHRRIHRTPHARPAWSDALHQAVAAEDPKFPL